MPETGVFKVCTFPGGATVKVDGAVALEATSTCPETKPITVTAKVAHVFEFSLKGYETVTISDPTKTTTGPGGVGQFMVRLTVEAGPGGAGIRQGVLELRAHDATDPTVSLDGAKPSIDHTSVEEKYIIPCKFRLPVSSKTGSRNYKVGASYPGYTDAEQTVTLTDAYTWDSPLVVDLALEPVRIWREVRITEKLALPTWVTDVKIPSIMAWNMPYSGWVKLRITRNVATDYQAYIDLHTRPDGWDGDISTLPAKSARINTEIAKGKLVWSTPVIKLNWDWVCEKLPEGVYVAVVIAAHWES